MTLAEHKKILDKLLALIPDDKKAEATGTLLDLETDYRTMDAESKDKDNRMSELEKQNKDYADVNMRLFLERRNKTDDTEPDIIDDPEPDNQDPPEKLKYEDLVL